MICPTCRELGKTSRVFVTSMQMDPKWIRRNGYYDENGDWKEGGSPYLEKMISTTDYRCSNGHFFSKTYRA